MNAPHRHLLLASALLLGSWAGWGCGRTEPEAEAKALAEARLPLAEAVAKAREAAAGGVAWEAEIGLEDGRPVYRIEFIAPDEARRIVVDARTGEIVGSEKVALDADERDLADRLLEAGERRVELVEALEKALSETPGGRVAEVDVEDLFDEVVYIVRTVAGGIQREAEVPALRGEPGNGEGQGGETDG